MKRAIFCAMFLAAANCSIAAEDKWYMTGMTSGYVSFASKGSLVKSGDTIKVWEWYVHKPGRLPHDNYKVHSSFDCKQRTYTVDTHIGFKDSEHEAPITFDAKPMEIVPDSSREGIMRFLCSGKYNRVPVASGQVVKVGRDLLEVQDFCNSNPDAQPCRKMLGR